MLYNTCIGTSVLPCEHVIGVFRIDNIYLIDKCVLRKIPVLYHLGSVVAILLMGIKLIL